MRGKIGDKIDKLKIIEVIPIKGKHTKYKVECDCGYVYYIEHPNLYRNNNKTKQCRECFFKQKALNDRKTNKYFVKDDFLECYTEKGEKFLLSIEDLDLLSDYCWWYDTKGYCVSDERKTGKRVKLHQIVMERKVGEYDKNLFVPDHLNRIKHDNRRLNLELKTYAENSQNTSLNKNNKTGMSGVSKRSNGKYLVRIGVEGKRICIGTFNTLEEAFKAREEAEKEYWKSKSESR